MLQVPLNAGGIEVGDLISADTGEQIQFGAELARLVHVNFFVRVSEENRVNVPRRRVQVTPPGDCGDDPRCQEFRAAFEEFQQTQPAPPEDLVPAGEMAAFSRLGGRR